MTDIHNRKDKFDNHVSALKENYNTHNADLILSCVNDLSSQDISIDRQARIQSSFNTWPTTSTLNSMKPAKTNSKTC